MYELHSLVSLLMYVDFDYAFKMLSNDKVLNIEHFYFLQSIYWKPNIATSIGIIIPFLLTSKYHMSRNQNQLWCPKVSKPFGINF